ncbi:OmpA family protein [Flavobacterium sp. C4GT6]|uniref:OmpA family protein n=1 Tax=Flavobacterium sp. C4GT6 TaxID=3103818 RepID=UPI002ED37AA7
MNRFFLLITLLLSGYINSQEQKKIVAADTKFNKYAFVDAIEIYESVIKQGYRSPELFQRLADSYYFNGQYAKAEEYYREYFTEEEKPNSEYLYRYSLCLKSKGKFTLADSLMNVFVAQNKQDYRARLFSDKEDYLEVIEENSGRYKISDLGINSDYSDYGPYILNNKLIFTSSRPNSRRPLIDKWSNQPYSSIYSADNTPDGNFYDVKIFDKNILSQYHESTPVFTKDGKTIYFTSSNVEILQKKGEQKLLLKLYKATYDGESWGDVKELSINEKYSNNAHPALSPDEKWLYFVSDRYGTVGSSDIYRVSINEDGTFGEPENLGLNINTEGRETFPYVSANNKLYFASDGHPGLGGLDVFCADISEDGSLKQPVNVGKPVNSESDDFSFIINDFSRIGFFASNRTNNFKSDNIFKINEISPIPEDFGQHKPIVGKVLGVDNIAKITLFDFQYDKILETKTNKEGEYNLGELGFGQYRIKVESDGYEIIEATFTVAKDKPEKAELTQELKKKSLELSPGTNLRDILNIRDLFFELNESDINQLAEADLAKILVFLKKNSEVKVKICAHTDSRGNEFYNLKLSQRRAYTTKSWLVDHGIDSNRIIAVGYGESKILNHCTNGVLCSEEEHQLNRRVDFILF